MTRKARHAVLALVAAVGMSLGVFGAPGQAVPYVQALAPGPDGIQPVDLASQDHCQFWSRFDAY